MASLWVPLSTEPYTLEIRDEDKRLTKAFLRSSVTMYLFFFNRANLAIRCHDGSSSRCLHIQGPGFRHPEERGKCPDSPGL